MKKQRMPLQGAKTASDIVSTPWELIFSLEVFFNREFDADLAATLENRKAEMYLGQHDPHDLSVEWPKNSFCWLNPPYSDIPRWLQRCMVEVVYNKSGSVIMALVPASVGANWYQAYCERFPVYFLRPRVTFDGQKWPYPKDLMLIEFDESKYSRGVKPETLIWRGKRKRRKKNHVAA